jgi:DNA polymerase-3 subunit beta
MINTNELRDAAEAAKKLVPTGTKAIKMLKNIQLTATAGELAVVSTNLTHTYRKVIDVSNKELEFNVVVDAAQLVKTLQRCKDNTIDVYPSEDALTITTKKSKYKINTGAVEEYPQLDVFTKQYTTIVEKIDAKHLKNLYEFTDKNGVFTYVLSGVNYRAGVLAASDGSRILTYNTKYKADITDDINIQAGFLKHITKSEYLMQVSEKRDFTRFLNYTDRSEYYTLNIEGQYPKYEQLIPDNYEAVKLYNKEFSEALKEVDLTVNNRINVVKFHWNTDRSEFYISSKNDDGETTTQIKTICSDLPNKYHEIAFNKTYLETFNKVAEAPALHFGSNNLYGVLVKYDDRDYTGVLMPVQIK